MTYTPGQPATGFATVEAGNVGQHYYAWRYSQVTAAVDAATDAVVSIPGRITLSLPAYSLSQSATVTISQNSPPTDTQLRAVSNQFEITLQPTEDSPDPLVEINIPVKMTVTYDPSLLPANWNPNDQPIDLGSYTDLGSVGFWDTFYPGTLDQSNNTITADVDHLSRWALFM